MVSLVYCMIDKPDFYVEGEAHRIQNKYEIVFFLFIIEYFSDLIFAHELESCSKDKI